MECNKDEAFRAKEIAERKFAANDIAGAKKFASKANSLYPGIDGISQMLAIVDVYVSAENKIDGEADWYRVLGVDPLADDETIRKQYRKMALVLHPDKNKSVGADGAFKLISDAWRLLSDKGNRAAFDQRRRAKAFPMAPTPTGRPAAVYGTNKPTGGPAASSGAYGANKPTGGPAASSGAYGSNKPARRPAAPSRARKKPTRRSAASSGAKIPNRYTKRGSSTSAAAHVSNSYSRNTTSSAGSSKNSTPAPSMNPTPNAFWTVCHRCKFYHEYLRVYINCKIRCPNCHEPFEAREAATPSFGSEPLTSWYYPELQNTTDEDASKNAFDETNENSLPIDGAADYTCYRSDPVSRAISESVAQQPNEEVKRDREEAEAVTKREEALQRKL